MKLRYYMRGLGIGMVVTALILGVSLRNHNAKMTDAEVIQRAEEMGMEQKYESGTLADMSAQQKKDSEEAGSKETQAGEEASQPVEKTEDPKPAESDKQETETTEKVSGGQEEAAKPDENTEAASAEEVKSEEAAEEAKPESGERTEEARPETEENTEATSAEEVKSEEAAEETKPESGEQTEEAKLEAEDPDKPDENKEATSAEEVKAEDAAKEKTEETQPATGDVTKQETTFVIRSGEGSDTVAKHLEQAGYVANGAAFDAFLCSKGYDTKLRAGSHTIPAGANAQQIAEALMGSPIE